MPSSFTTNPISTILRSGSPPPFGAGNEPSSPRSPRSLTRPRSPNSPLSPRSRQRKRGGGVSVRLPRPPQVPALTLRRTGAAAGAMDDEEAGGAAATELLVLAHGLQGTVEDFTYLLEELRASPAATNGRLLVHASRVNTDKTHDGIVLGGLRLAEDIRAVVGRHEKLESISMMGFSLGGLYVRYAVGHLFQAETGRIAGLRAEKIILVASPNLGVRRFGFYRFLPGPVLPMAHALFGYTVTQLLLRDEEQLLMEMTTDRNSHGMQFVSGLRAFRERLLYANVRNDFMVNYGTAALDHTVQMVGGADVERVVGRQGGQEAVDSDYDEKGCRICFQLRYEEEGGEEEEREAVGEGGEEDVEEVMSKRLKRIGWTVIGVDFPLAMPIAHNRIVAMSRNAIHTWINAGGRRVVHHLVDTFSKGFEEHEPKFRQVTAASY